MSQTTSPSEQQNQSAEPREQLAVKGEYLYDKVKELIHEGNVRRLIIKQNGHTIVEIPVTWGVLGALLSPTLAAVGAIGMMVSDCTLEIIRTETEDAAQPES
ncbi:MAG: DUF4342 domain-containing protein [Chloroflexi bacterium]|nr:DUF4342 domain-containing protein [Chloroflexota bacterium]OJV90214.1 MAG: hypothetical protein BGO39_02305 [Chloroflexi bacterium 54-19]